jgi:ketopantoate reductase
VERREERILVVGAGAVGQVYGMHLRRGGARLSFLVKPAHTAWCQQGFALHRLQARRVTETDRLDDIEVLTDAAAAASLGWDQVWLAVASDALRGDWLGAFLGALGDATVVALQPDLDDRTRLLLHLPEARLVQGLIGFLAFQSPLPEAGRLREASELPSGIAYALLPPVASTFSGATARVQPILRVLAAGGFRARAVRDVVEASALRSAASVPVVAALELSDWSLIRLRRGPHLALGLRAAREAREVVADHFDRAPSQLTRLLRPLPVGLALRLAAHAAPVDLEQFLRFHFTKVGPQTRLMLDTWCDHAAAAGLPSRALSELRQALG